MHVPNAAFAEIAEAKITKYLLNLEHKKGGSKAKAFLAKGFSLNEWMVLGNALLAHILAYEVTNIDDIPLGETIPLGQSYAVEGYMLTPSGSQIYVRSCWTILHADPNQTPRLGSAYPCKAKK